MTEWTLENLRKAHKSKCVPCCILKKMDSMYSWSVLGKLPPKCNILQVTCTVRLPSSARSLAKLTIQLFYVSMHSEFLLLFVMVNNQGLNTAGVYKWGHQWQLQYPPPWYADMKWAAREPKHSHTKNTHKAIRCMCFLRVATDHSGRVGG